eukprot:m.31019 g.31019  ORF g.31019 m.31019 type:complete len:582 (-) comp8270_c0_seq1:87-1832(-)
MAKKKSKGKKSGGKKGKGKKGKGKKGKKSGKGKKKSAAVEETILPLQWPWETALRSWMGPSEYNRAQLRRKIREGYLPESDRFPLCDKVEWGSVVNSYREPFKDPTAECMVTMLVSLVGYEGDRKIPPDDFIFLAASLRCQKSQPAFERMSIVVDSFLALLDGAPPSIDIFNIFSEKIRDSFEGHVPVSNIKSELEVLDFTFGDMLKIRHRARQLSLSTFLNGGPLPELRIPKMAPAPLTEGVIPARVDVETPDIDNPDMDGIMSNVIYNEKLMTWFNEQEEAFMEMLMDNDEMDLSWRDVTGDSYPDLKDANKEDEKNNEGQNTTPLAELTQLHMYIAVRFPALGHPVPIHTSANDISVELTKVVQVPKTTVREQEQNQGEEEENETKTVEDVDVSDEHKEVDDTEQQANDEENTVDTEEKVDEEVEEVEEMEEVEVKVPGLERKMFPIFMYKLFYTSKLWSALRCCFQENDFITKNNSPPFIIPHDRLEKHLEKLLAVLDMEDSVEQARDKFFPELEEGQVVQDISMEVLTTWYFETSVETDKPPEWVWLPETPRDKPLKFTLESLTELIHHAHYITRR